MQKIFSIPKKQIPGLFVIVILAVMAVYYFFNYIPESEKDLTERHFGWLQSIDDNVRQKITGVDSILSTLMKVYVQVNGKNDYVEDYFNKFKETNHLTLQYGTNSCSKYPKTPFNDTINQFSIGADSVLSELYILVQKKTSTNSKSIYRCDSIVTTYNFSDFIKPLLIPHVFDHYVVFYNGRYIYEDFHSGLSYKNEDSLLIDNRSKSIMSASVFVQKIGGINYRIFLQPIAIGNIKLIVAGLHDEQRFRKEIKKLPGDVVIFFIVITLTLLLFIPWIKIYFMGKYDRLYLKDALLAMVVAKLLISLIFYFFFLYNANSKPNKTNDDQKFLAKTITNSFNEEICAAYKILDSLDRLKKSKQEIFSVNIIGVGKDTLKSFNGDVWKINKYKELKQKNAIDSIVNRENFSFLEINWLNDAGDQKTNWTKNDFTDILGNYHDRDYFSSIKNDSPKLIPGEKPEEANSSFTVDQIFSRTSNNFSTVIAKKTDSVLNPPTKGEQGVVAMLFNAKSLDSVILSSGYQFAIIDNMGKVRYHSNLERNLNENLLNEFSKSDAYTLSNALKARFNTSFQTEYNERMYEVWMQPMLNFPYFIVILRSTEEADMLEMSSFGFTMAMIFMLLLIAMLDILVLICASARHSYFKKQFLVTSWLWPIQSLKNVYKLTFWVYLGLLVLVLCLTIYANLFSFLGHIYVLILSILFMSTFLNAVLMIKYHLEGNEIYTNYKIRASVCNGVLIVICNIIALTNASGSFCNVAIYEILLLAALAFILYGYWRNKKKHLQGKEKEGNERNKSYKVNCDDYVKWYTRMIFTRLLISSGVPVILFFTAKYNYEQSLSIRHKQTDFAQNLQKKFGNNLKKLNSSLNYYNAVYKNNLAIDCLSVESSKRTYDSLSREDGVAARLLNTYGSYNADYYRTTSYDTSFAYNNIFQNIFNEKPESTFLRLSKDTLNFLITAKKDSFYQYPKILDDDMKGWLFYFSFAVTILCLYFLLSFIVKKLFAKENASAQRDYDFRQNIFAKLETNNILFVGLAEESFNTIKSGLQSYYPIDFNELCKGQVFNDTLWNTIKVQIKPGDHIVVFHFENYIFNKDLNCKKLDVLEHLIQENKRITILSELPPSIIRDRMPKSFNNADKNIEFLRDKERIQRVLEHFLIIPIPFTFSSFKTKSNVDEHAYLENLINAETSYSNFLHGFRKQLLTVFRKQTNGNQAKKVSFLRRIYDSFDQSYRERERDLLILKIQEMSHEFYLRIWRSLTESEKLVLYDLAEDGLVNTKNAYFLEMLLARGLIIEEEGRLHIFNRSFRNFILTSLGKDELAKLNKKFREGRRWNKLQAPLIIFIIAILVFVSITQEASYTRIIAIISGLATGIPLLLKLFESFNNNNNLNSLAGKSSNDANAEKPNNVK